MGAREITTRRRTIRRMIGASAVIAATAMLVGSPGAQAARSAAAPACANADAQPGTVSPGALADATVCLVNRVRAAHRLPLLTRQKQLDSFASGFARQMVSRKFFSHDVPGGPTFASRARASAYARGARTMPMMGENIAWATAELATPAEIVTAWMNSPGHRENILRRQFREIGVGVSLAAPEAGWGPADGPATYVHSFGVRVAKASAKRARR